MVDSADRKQKGVAPAVARQEGSGEQLGGGGLLDSKWVPLNRASDLKLDGEWVLLLLNMRGVWMMRTILLLLSTSVFREDTMDLLDRRGVAVVVAGAVGLMWRIFLDISHQLVPELVRPLLNAAFQRAVVALCYVARLDKLVEVVSQRAPHLALNGGPFYVSEAFDLDPHQRGETFKGVCFDRCLLDFVLGQEVGHADLVLGPPGQLSPL